MPARTGYYEPPQGLLSDQTPTAYQQRWGLNYDPNYQPITGYQNMSYTDAVNQGYSPAMSEAAARGQGIPQYAAAPGPNIDDMDNVARREAQGDGAGLFAMGMAGILGAAGLIPMLGGGAAATGAGSTAGTGAGAAGTAAGTAGTTAGTAGGLGAASAIPEGIEGVTVIGSSGAGAGTAAGAAGGIGGAASFWDSVNQGASDTSATNAQNEQDLQNMDAPSLGTDWQQWLQRANQARGLLGGGGQQTPMMGGGGSGLLGGGGGSVAHGVPSQSSRVFRSPLERYMAQNRMAGLLKQ